MISVNWKLNWKGYRTSKKHLKNFKYNLEDEAENSDEDEIRAAFKESMFTFKLRPRYLYERQIH